jgi:hypothetical protein
MLQMHCIEDIHELLLVSENDCNTNQVTQFTPFLFPLLLLPSGTLKEKENGHPSGHTISEKLVHGDTPNQILPQHIETPKFHLMLHSHPQLVHLRKVL